MGQLAQYTQLHVDATAFSGMVAELTRISGATHEKVLTSEAGKVLELCVKYTPAADKTKMGMRYQSRMNRRYNTYSGGYAGRDAKDALPRISVTKTGKWWVDKNAKGERTFYDMDERGIKRKFGTQRWARFKAEDSDRIQDREEAIREGTKRLAMARGVCKESWVQVADSLGVDIKVPKWVRNAMPTTGRKYRNGTATKEGTADKFIITLANAQPILVARGGDAIISRALRTRQKAFENNVKNGVFYDIKARAQRYPGIFVK